MKRAYIFEIRYLNGNREQISITVAASGFHEALKLSSACAPIYDYISVVNTLQEIVLNQKEKS